MFYPQKSTRPQKKELPITLKTNFTTLTKNSAFTFTWQENALIQGETVFLGINGQVEGDARLFSQSGAGATHMILPVN